MNQSMKGLITVFLLMAIALASPAFAQKKPGPGPGPSPARPPKGKQSPSEQYTIDQSVSDKAQLSTIAFSGLAFMTGTFGANTFLPPDKAADYFGFQYLRDIDVREAGHNMMFLGNIANNMLATLDAGQKALFLDLARELSWTCNNDTRQTRITAVSHSAPRGRGRTSRPLPAPLPRPPPCRRA